MQFIRLSPLRFSPSGSRNPLAWIIGVVALALTGLAVLLYGLSYQASLGPRWGPRGFMIFFAVMFSAMGIVVATRRPRNRIGWIYLWAGWLCALQGFGEEYAAYALLARPGWLPGGVWLAWLQNWIWVPVVGLYLAFVPLLLPEGRLPSPRWRPVAWFAAITTAVLSFFYATLPGRLGNFYPVVNPLGMNGLPVLWPRLMNLAMGLVMLAIMAAAVSLVLRVRHATPIERQQLKWVAVACAFGATGMIGSVVFGYYSTLSEPLIIGGMVGMHVATALAILRFRLYDIDVVLNRTLVYGLLTAALAGIYFGCVVILQQVAVSLTGERQSTLVTVLSTLAIAALFTPLRRSIQAAIDRRFFRYKYDAAKALARFSQAIREDTQGDLGQISADLVRLVEETLEPASASLWVRPAPGNARPQVDQREPSRAAPGRPS